MAAVEPVGPRDPATRGPRPLPPPRRAVAAGAARIPLRERQTPQVSRVAPEARQDDVEPVNNYGRYGLPASAPAPHRRGADPDGRYDGRRERTWHPSEGLAVAAADNADTTVAAVVDPYGDGEERILATVNRRVDILELERSHGRISQAAYLTGRRLQAVFERSTRIGGSSAEGGSRRDPREVRIYLMAKRVCDARETLDLTARLGARIGDRSIRLLRRILGDGKSYAEAATAEGKGGPRGTTFIAESFRCALEDAVAVLEQSRGAVAPPPDDKHLAAAATIEARQDLAIAGGATRHRLRGEVEALRAAAAATRAPGERTRLGSEADGLAARLAWLEQELGQDAIGQDAIGQDVARLAGEA